jgi:hypothetical protein
MTFRFFVHGLGFQWLLLIVMLAMGLMEYISVFIWYSILILIGIRKRLLKLKTTIDETYTNNLKNCYQYFNSTYFNY